MLVLLREVHHLRHLCLGNFICEYAAYPDALLMDMQHHACGLIRVHLEKCLQHMDDKFHGRIVIIQQKHLVQVRLLRFGARARCQADTRGAASFIVIVLRHIYLHHPKIGQAMPTLQPPFTIYYRR